MSSSWYLEEKTPTDICKTDEFFLKSLQYSQASICIKPLKFVSGGMLGSWMIKHIQNTWIRESPSLPGLRIEQRLRLWEYLCYETEKGGCQGPPQRCLSPQPNVWNKPRTGHHSLRCYNKHSEAHHKQREKRIQHRKTATGLVFGSNYSGLFTWGQQTDLWVGKLVIGLASC